MTVRGLEPAFKAFERIQRTKEVIVNIISGIIPSIQSALWSRGPQDPNDSKSNKSKSYPVGRVPFVSLEACPVSLRTRVETLLLSQKRHPRCSKGVLVPAQALPCSARRSKASPIIPSLAKNNLGQRL